MDPELVAVEIELVRLRLLLAEGRWDEVIERTERLDRLTARRHLGEHRLTSMRLGAAALAGAGLLDRAAAAYRVLRAVLATYGEAPELERAVRLDLGATLVRAGRLPEARAELDSLGPAHPVFDGPRFRARRTWWSGVAAARLGRDAEGDELLATATRDLAAAGLTWEAFLALLDRLELYLASGLAARAAELLDEATPLHRSETLPGWASGLLLHLQVHAWAGTLTVADVDRARALLAAAPVKDAGHPRQAV